MSRRALVEAHVRLIVPRIPRHELGAVTDHALDSRGLRGADPERAAWLSLVAYIRHVMTDYDELLREGYDADSARFFVRDAMDEILEGWGATRRLPDEEEDAGDGA